MSKRKEIETDQWFEQQMELLKGMDYPGEVDVVDSVMEAIDQLPQTQRGRVVAMPRRRKVAIAAGAAAACLAAVVLVRMAIPTRQIQTGKETLKEISSGIYEIFNYCQSYTESDYPDDASCNDNPFIELLP